MKINKFLINSKFIKLDEYTFHYIDKGQGDVLLLLHGNPTWSYFYRNIIEHFSKSFRVIALDHLGCGLSEKNSKAEYTLTSHINNLKLFIDKLKLTNITIMAHDWGGAIAMGYITKNISSIHKIILLNTAAFHINYLPWRIKVFRPYLLGSFLARCLNLFLIGAIHFCSKKKLTKDVKKGFLYPYKNWKSRRSIDTFVKDIPLTKNHISYQKLKEIESDLPSLNNHKILICWGKYDWCFNMKFLDKWQKILPNAKVCIFDAGHFLLEDKKQEIIFEVEKFLSNKK